MAMAKAAVATFVSLVAMMECNLGQETNGSNLGRRATGLEMRS